MDYVEAQENYGIEEENEVDAVNLDEDDENIAETPAVGNANVRSELVNLPPRPPSAPRPLLMRELTYQLIGEELKYYLRSAPEDRRRWINTLEWWRSNGTQYPMLSRLARDILNVPMSTVASENPFSQGRQQLGDNRHSLGSNTMNVLICLRDWIRAEIRNQGMESEPSDELKLEEIMSSRENSAESSPMHDFAPVDFDYPIGVVLVALSRPPSFYVELLKSKGFDVTSSSKWLRVLDCYSDPLGWKSKLMERGTVRNPYEETVLKTSLCKNLKELDKALSSIIELGKEIVEEGNGRFAVAIDSVSEILRHSSPPSVARILSHLRSHDQVSCIFCLLHVDLHEAKVAATLEYLSTMHADVEPIVQRTNGLRNTSEDLPMVEQCFKRGKFHVRFKRRNGRVKVMREELYVEGSGIKFTEVSSADGLTAQGLVPKVQFNLELSEKEKLDRAKVVLPFEHQGTGKPIQIYNGRKSLNESETEEKQASVDKPQTPEDSGRGEIIYFRDSDDEMPDSDEDPDDDLDI
ncbi:Elongator complex protein 5 [Capsicum baccatum]|uniref:Elongator complex protein 5 n=1 Tax=Capsicum baccatum TaxID=33114 RepID=A0A2G2XGR7_CAPBA|nr:Elongator complex protein 5 [Capsicum baccatum]